MCGIGAVIHPTSDPERARLLVLALIRELSVRGSMAAGIAAFRKGRVFVAKARSPFELIEKLSRIRGWELSDVILVHTRAATTCFHSFWCHHPLVDVVGDRVVALVHNGVVSYTEEPVPTRYDVDTDLLLGFYRKYGFNRKALERMYRGFSGWAAMLATDGRELHILKAGAPLVGTSVSGMHVFASTTGILLAALAEVGLARIKPRKARRLVHKEAAINVNGLRIAPVKSGVHVIRVA